MNNTHQFNQDFTKVWGSHAFFPHEWLWRTTFNTISNPRLSSVSAAPACKATGRVPNTGGIARGHQLGYAISHSYAQQGQSNLPVDSNHSFYFQDDWRIRPNLTLNLGVRYSNETPAHSKFPGLLSVGSLDVKDNYYTGGSVPGVLTCPQGGCVGGWIQPKGFLWNRDNNNFRPRIGLAWSINRDTVVRAGFAMMTLDWNLGWTNQSEIGGGSFYNQSVSQPANVYTPLFNINQGVPAFTSRTAPILGTTIPTSVSSPSARPTITVVPLTTTSPTALNLWMSAFSAPSMITWWSCRTWACITSASAAITTGTRGLGAGIDPNGASSICPCRRIGLPQHLNNRRASTAQASVVPTPRRQLSQLRRMWHHSGTIKLEKRYRMAELTFRPGRRVSRTPRGQSIPGSAIGARSPARLKYRYVSSMTESCRSAGQEADEPRPLLTRCLVA